MRWGGESVLFFQCKKGKEGEWMNPKKRCWKLCWLLKLAVIAVLMTPFYWTLAKQTWAESGQHWSLGDVIIREIHGKAYKFRCIDSNYTDRSGYRRPGALFLCDSVISADFGSRYELDTGQIPHDYVFYPGPVVNFGETGEYKTSRIRAWLQTAESVDFADAEPVSIGVDRFCTGGTEIGAYERLLPESISASYVGSQKMTDRLFILSVDEALRYRDWLWRFHGSGKRNPETQINSFCKGYWLRTALGNGPKKRGEPEPEYVYIVDLEGGNIRPERVKPEAAPDETDQELLITGTTGIRPVFVLPQRF